MYLFLTCLPPNSALIYANLQSRQWETLNVWGAMPDQEAILYSNAFLQPPILHIAATLLTSIHRRGKIILLPN